MHISVLPISLESISHRTSLHCCSCIIKYPLTSTTRCSRLIYQFGGEWISASGGLSAPSVMRLLSLRSTCIKPRISCSEVSISFFDQPRWVGRRSFSVVDYIISSGAGSMVRKVCRLPKKNSTRSFLTIACSTSPNATMGARISPMLKFSVTLVNLYVGLVTLDVSWRAIWEARRYR